MEEEREAVQLALKRLTPKETYDRVYRIRRATQCSYQHKLLAKADWTKPEDVCFAPRFQAIYIYEKQQMTNRTLLQDISYLQPLVTQIEAELAEKDALDSASVLRKH